MGVATAINALFNVKINRNVMTWTLGIIGTLLSVIGIINYFTNFLTLLGVAIPPVAGIMVVDYFILKRSRATLDASRAKGELPEKVEKWNPIALIVWALAFCVGRGLLDSGYWHSGPELAYLRRCCVLGRYDHLQVGQEG